MSNLMHDPVTAQTVFFTWFGFAGGWLVTWAWYWPKIQRLIRQLEAPRSLSACELEAPRSLSACEMQFELYKIRHGGTFYLPPGTHYTTHFIY